MLIYHVRLADKVVAEYLNQTRYREFDTRYIPLEIFF